MATPVNPLLKWPGSKRKIARFIDLAFRGPCRGVYVEPFLGSGAVYLHRRAVGTVRGAYLSDVSEKLIGFHLAIQGEVERVIRELARMPAGDDWADWYTDIRDQFNAGEPTGARHAARMLWLNRACFNGVYRENSRGEFNVPVGKYDRISLPSAARLREVSAALAGAKIEVADFRSVLCRHADQVYCDPPYVPLSPTASFTSYSAGGFGLRDQAALMGAAANCVSNGATVVLSNADVPLVRELYPEERWKLYALEVSRSISRNGDGRKKTGEVLILGPRPK